VAEAALRHGYVIGPPAGLNNFVSTYELRTAVLAALMAAGLPDRFSAPQLRSVLYDRLRLPTDTGEVKEVRGVGRVRGYLHIMRRDDADIPPAAAAAGDAAAVTGTSTGASSGDAAAHLLSPSPSPFGGYQLGDVLPPVARVPVVASRGSSPAAGAAAAPTGTPTAVPPVTTGTAHVTTGAAAAAAAATAAAGSVIYAPPPFAPLSGQKRRRPRSEPGTPAGSGAESRTSNTSSRDVSDNDDGDDDGISGPPPSRASRLR